MAFVLKWSKVIRSFLTLQKWRFNRLTKCAVRVHVYYVRLYAPCLDLAPFFE